MDLLRQLVIVRRWAAVVGLAVVATILPAYVLASREPARFEATTSLLVGPSISGTGSDYNQLLIAQYLSKVYVRVATSPETLANVIEDLGLSTTPGELAGDLTVTAEDEPAVINIAARGATSEEAVALANAVAAELESTTLAGSADTTSIGDERVRAYVASLERLISELQTQVDSLAARPSLTPEQGTQLTTLQDRLAALMGDYVALRGSVPGAGPGTITVLAPAVAPAAQVAPRVLYYTLAGAMLGLFIGVAIAFVLEYLSDRFHGADEVHAAVRVRTLGVIEQDGRIGSGRGRLVARSRPSSPAAASYRRLRANIEFAVGPKHVRTLLITGDKRSPARPLVAANLATVFAQEGHRILLIDGDSRSGFRSLFRLSGQESMTSLLWEPGIPVRQLAEATGQKDLWVLTTTRLSPNSPAAPPLQRMRMLVTAASEEFDLVIVDQPPVLDDIDAASLASVLDATLLVIDLERSRRNSATEAVDQLTAAHANLLGVAIYGGQAQGANARPPEAAPVSGGAGSVGGRTAPFTASYVERDDHTV